METQDKSTGRIFLKNTLFLYLRSAYTQLIDILIVVAIMRKLPVAGFGIYSFLIGLIGYIQVFTIGGIGTVALRFIPEYTTKNMVSYAKQLIRNSFIFSVPLLLLVLGLIFIFADPIGSLFQIQHFKRYFAFFAFYAFLFLFDLLNQCVLASMLFQKYLAITYVSYATFRALLFGLIFYLNGVTIMNVLLVETIAYALLFSLNLMVLIQKFWMRHAEGCHPFTAEESQRLLRYGLLSSFNELGATTLKVSANFYVVSAFLGPYFVGLYAFGERIHRFLDAGLPLRKGYEVMSPLFFSSLQDAPDERINKVFNFLMKLSIFFVLPVAVFTGVLGREIINNVFSPKYLAAYWVLAILMVYLVWHSILFVLNLVAQLKEKMEVLLYSKVFAVYNIIASILVIKIWGIEGVALASLSALVFQNIYIYYMLKKDMAIKLHPSSHLRIVLNASATGVMLYLLKGQIVNLLSLILVLVLGSLVYLLLCHINKSFSREETDLINKTIKMPIWSF